MSTLVESKSIRNRVGTWIAVGLALAVIASGILTPHLNRSRMAANESVRAERQRALKSGLSGYLGQTEKTKSTFTNLSYPSGDATTSEDSTTGRRMIRTGAIDMIVQRPAEASQKIQTWAEQAGGFLVSSETRGGQAATAASLTIRVPAHRLAELSSEIRKLGLRTESEKIEAQDATGQYVDQDANLRNLRAEERQYLSILKQAKTVKDTLEVSEKLSGVRGQIEQQQAEFDALSKQIETVAIAVSLRAEAEAHVLGLNWRPLYQVKLALRDGMDGVGDYASAMTAAVLYLPALLLWLATILVVAAVGWKGVRVVGRRVFGWANAAAVVEPSR